MKTSETKLFRKFTMSIIIIIILLICLCITTYALARESVYVADNYFHTGTIDINLNDGKPVIKEREYIFEPGMTVKKDFFVENNSSWDVYYKLYLENIEGELADVLIITIKDGDEVLYSGKATELTRKKVEATDDSLAVNERKDLEIFFHYPTHEGNDTQDQLLMFDMVAEAVQTKNNPDKLFD